MTDLPRVRSWGGMSAPARELLSEDLESITRDVGLTRGLGRSYGDAPLPPRGATVIAGAVLADRILSFDRESGLLRAEAGLSLDRLIGVLRLHGFFPPVVPGTRFVTLGGMVAADVHGKNHHIDGTFGRHVEWLRLRLAEGEIVECSRTVDGELFRATLGGMGLTGHILEVEFRAARVPSPWILGRGRRVAGIDEFLAALAEEAGRAPFTVGWIDCLASGRGMGRGVLLSGRWADAAQAPARAPRSGGGLPVPFALPDWVLGRSSVRLFNALYYRFTRIGERIFHPDAFFFPLDFLSDWYRLYGRAGMTQFQCVLPEKERPGATRRFLEVLAARGGASFLSVIKDCGEEGEGLLSFPRPGVSIAVDLAVRGDIQALIDALAAATLAEGGRVYLAKDGYLRRDHFHAMEPRLAEFLRVKRRVDPRGRLRSAQFERLMESA